jgi:Ca2+-transporting ATPase
LLARQFADPLVTLLVAAAIVSAAIGDGLEAVVIGAIVLLNAALGFGQEVAAEQAMGALRAMSAQPVDVIRDGAQILVSPEEVVPGDLLVLREGGRIAADGRIVASVSLAADESALTGESVPVEKSVEVAPAAAQLGDRSSMAYAATAITRGRGRAVVTATGDATEVGRIALLAERAEPPPTPLQRRLGRLARAMVGAGILLTVALAAGSLINGSSLHESFLIGVAVAVAAVPEGLAATVTVALALGARAMAERGAIVRRLSAIETIGQTTTICADKTGTLTENRLRLTGAYTAEDIDELTLLSGAVLASSAELIRADDGATRGAGDPIEVALLLAALERGLSREDLLAGRKRVHEMPFDATRKRMTIAYAESGGVVRAFSKGAPETVLERATVDPAERQRLETHAHEWASEGLRVLAVCDRVIPDTAGLDDNLEQDMRPLGLVALHDQLREAAPAAVREARAAGVTVRILTGDHPRTAAMIGRALGLPPDAVYARVTPEEKLRLVEQLQQAGEVVAVTGDGVNDAPALRQADVGIAMGRSGTEAAREASSIVLTDDNFATIVAAIREGRRIADNIRNVVAFLLSANLGEVVLFAIAVLAGIGAPMTVIQVLTVNILTDGLPAIALARDPASVETMSLGPRPQAALIPRPLAAALGAIGMLVGLAGLAAFLIGRAIDPATAQTMAYATIALSELALVFSCRSVSVSAWRLPANRYLVGGVVASVALLVATVYVTALHALFGSVPLGPGELAATVGLAVVPFVALESAKAAKKRSSPDPTG